MDREVFMGDETREILRSEVVGPERNGSAPTTSAQTPDAAHDARSYRRSTQPSPATSRSPVSPWVPGKERRKYTMPGLSTTSPFGTHFHRLEQPRRSPQQKRQEPLTRLSVPPRSPGRAADRTNAGSSHRAASTTAADEYDISRLARTEDSDPRPPAKRQRMDPDSSKLPELDLEIDVGFDILLDESPHDTLADARDLPQLHHHKEVNPGPALVNGAAAEGENDTDVESLRAQVDTLKSLLISKQEDIQALHAELNEREEQHQAEIQKIKQDMHREYSRQASDKLRVIIKRLELSAKKRAEQDWKDRVSKLSEVVENERNEKAELVQACDEYLRLKGF